MNPSPSPDVDLSVFGIVALVVAAAALALWWWRARGGTTGTGPIQLLALRPLGGKRMLALVEVEDERFLLGMTDASISCLGRLGAERSTDLRQAKGEAA